ncbi:hypothetical protein FS935_01825 [Metabacillus litoralis]|uniref:Uncharacterized protein n=1 Tax=Metabacillus litoralis TaxID=152268 RepID=A0A5C6W4U2_9BACI|nr:hypothetical protein [Metabacillus litoralis]TXC92956.1 hypothetical protein FS935_01825 [Metabacillus litoralis]
MFEMVRKINLKTAIITGIYFYFLTIFIHILIVSGWIPLNWVNGGRSGSFATQLPISILNIMISISGVLFTSMYRTNTLLKFKRGITIICWLFVFLWTFGFIQQLFGTPFEKIICSPLLFLGVMSNLRMAVEKR